MDRHIYNTRRKENFVLQKPRTNFLKRSFKYSAIELWNSKLSTRWEKLNDKFVKKVQQTWYGTAVITYWKINKAF